MIAKVLPVNAGYALASLIARIYYCFASKDKEALRANLKVVLGKDTDEKRINHLVLMVFRNFAKYLIDFFRKSSFSEDYLTNTVTFKGKEQLHKCLSEGKGVILVALHLGNWELGGAILGWLKYPISAIVLEHSNQKVNEFFRNRRSIYNLKSIPLGMQVKKCFKLLKNNEMLAIVGDKDYTSNGIPVDFFGKKAILPKGPAVLSLKTGARLLFCIVAREKNDKFTMFFEEPDEYIPTGDFESDVEGLMGQYVKVFEKYIKQYPDQWYAFEKIWNQEKIIQ